MIYALFLFGLAAQVADDPKGKSPLDRYIPLQLGLVQGLAERFVDLPIEICGVEDRTISGRRVLNRSNGRDTIGVYMQDGTVQSRMDGPNACFVGVWRRTDGKSFSESAKIPVSVISHGYNPDYILAKN